MKFTMQEKKFIAALVQFLGLAISFSSLLLALFSHVHTLPFFEMMIRGLSIILVGILGYYMFFILSRRIRTPSPGVPLDE
jgi:cytochrome c biogenesis protein CcdA